MNKQSLFAYDYYTNSKFNFIMELKKLYSNKKRMQKFYLYVIFNKLMTTFDKAIFPFKNLLLSFCTNRDLTTLLSTNSVLNSAAEKEFNRRSVEIFRKYFSSWGRSHHWEWDRYLSTVPARAICNRVLNRAEGTHEIDVKVIEQMLLHQKAEFIAHRFLVNQQEGPAIIFFKIHAHISLEAQAPFLDSLLLPVTREERERREKALMEQNVVGIILSWNAHYNIFKEEHRYIAKPF